MVKNRLFLPFFAQKLGKLGYFSYICNVKNGRGGGDFRGESELVGSWARDVISVEATKSAIPKDYTELKFDLVE